MDGHKNRVSKEENQYFLGFKSFLMSILWMLFPGDSREELFENVDSVQYFFSLHYPRVKGHFLAENCPTWIINFPKVLWLHKNFINLQNVQLLKGGEKEGCGVREERGKKGERRGVRQEGYTGRVRSEGGEGQEGWKEACQYFLCSHWSISCLTDFFNLEIIPGRVLNPEAIKKVWKKVRNYKLIC